MALNKVVTPDRTGAFVDGKGQSKDQFYNWVGDVTQQLNGIEIQGSPEGVVDAPRFFLCANILTDKLYIKTTSAGILTGWHLLNP